MTTSEQAAKNRKTLEKTGKLPENHEFEDRVKHEKHNLLLVLALLTALFGGLAMHFVYKTSAPAESLNNHPEDFEYKVIK